MKLKKVLIIEDEKPNADRLKRLLLKIRPNIQILGVEESIASSITWLTNNEHPDLILMDIRLSDGLSFEIFTEVEINAPIIFTTAYDEYAVKAFKYNSLDYLLKPIDEDELTHAIERFENTLSNTSVQTNAVAGFVDYFQPKEYRKRFLLAYKDGYKTLLTESIFYFQSELGITQVVLKNGTRETVPQSLEELEKQLDPQLFFRVNRQFIIHMDSVRKVLNHFNGKLKLELRQHPDSDVLISREKATTFKTWMDF